MNGMKRHRCQGFTLLELTVALLLLALMSSVLYGTLSLSANSWDRGESKTNQVSDMRLTEEFLRQVLSGTIAGLSASQVGGIAFWAHVGGFAAGVVLHRLFILPERERPRRFERDEYGIEGAWASRL